MKAYFLLILLPRILCLLAMDRTYIKGDLCNFDAMGRISFTSQCLFLGFMGLISPFLGSASLHPSPFPLPSPVPWAQAHEEASTTKQIMARATSVFSPRSGGKKKAVGTLFTPRPRLLAILPSLLPSCLPCQPLTHPVGR